MPYELTQKFTYDVALHIYDHEESTIPGREFFGDRESFGDFKDFRRVPLSMTVFLEGDELDEGGFILDSQVLCRELAPVIAEFADIAILDRHDPMYGALTGLLNDENIVVRTVDYRTTLEHMVKDLFGRIQTILSEVASTVRLRKVSLQPDTPVVAAYRAS